MEDGYSKKSHIGSYKHKNTTETRNKKQETRKQKDIIKKRERKIEYIYIDDKIDDKITGFTFTRAIYFMHS